MTGRKPIARTPFDRLPRPRRTGRPMCGAMPRAWLGVLALGVIGAASCTSAAPPPPAARPRSAFGQDLSLAVSFGSRLTAAETSATAVFTLTNDGPAAFEGCLGPSWGVSVIVGAYDSGHIVRVEHPRCDQKLAVLPGQKITWSRKVPLSDLRAGTARVTGWVKVIDPAACDPNQGCRETSVASPPMTMAIGER